MAHLAPPPVRLVRIALLLPGIADRVGSLEAGKDATLILTDGDVLEEPTHVEGAWIGGRAIDLSDRQKTLDAKYREKSRRAMAATAGQERP